MSANVPGYGHGHSHSSSVSSSQAAALPNHQLGELIGRGAFGAVYRALNWQTGETVAVKQIALGSIPPSELPEIMSEIDLLKNLDHPNVVQYRGFVKTRDFLWIVLEYCENGSLTAICKKFGKFPESLCQIYICQVLEGLLYLHDQGVIHRDIKGSNILATKEGSIKLADFGVATRVGGHDRSVVGSPYWMAPEVVEQSGATTASDIWSVGCVVIELLEGQPPYHELEPMPALFRIVNDDCPPLPDSASPVVRDFLLQCFQKDSNLRISARKLLRHPWMVSARKQLDQTKLRQSSASPSGLSLLGASRRHISAYDETVQRVQAWNKVLDKQQPVPHTQPLSTRVPASRLSEDVASALQQGPSKMRPVVSKAGKNLLEEMLPKAPTSPARRPSISMNTLVHQEDDNKENDNWDSDFLEDIPSTKKVHTGHQHQKPLEQQVDIVADNTDTIKPGSISPMAATKPAARALSPLVEDWSDLVPEEEAKPFMGRLSNMKQRPTDAKKRVLHPRDLSSGTQKAIRTLTPSATIRASASNSNTPISTPVQIAKLHTTGPKTPLSKTTLERFDDSESEDYSDAFDERMPSHGSDSRKLELTKKLSSKSWLGDDDLDEEDPFAEVEQILDAEQSNDSLEADVHRDKIARMCSFVNDLLDGMSAEADELAIRDGCIYLVDIFEQAPEVKLHFIRSHGLLTIVESLQSIRSGEVMGLELRIINLLIADNPDWLEKICLIGGCPVIMKFSHSRYSRDIRLEAALFIGAMCRTSLLTLQMFISCRGLRTLVDMMDENYRDQKDLVWMAVDGICRVFDMQASTVRNDFCRMFAKEGLLDPLSSALLAVADDDDELAQSALYKIVHVLLIFAQSDLKVKTELAQRSVALRLVRSLSIVPQDLLPMLLKTIKNLSMAPAALEVLQNANSIEALVKVLRQHIDVTEICNPLVNALYNLCRLSKSRQEEAALAGAVHPLQRLVDSNSPLKQFALPIICDFAHASKTCRKILWQHNIFKLYIGLLNDPFWNLSALEAILAWLQDEMARIEDALLEDGSIDALLRTFSAAKATSFENILEPLLKILRLSSNLCNKLVTHSSLFRRLIERLSSHPKAVVRLNLLKVIKTLFEAATDPPRISKQPNLVSTVNRLVEDDPSLLVKDLAKGLLKEFTDVEKKSKNQRLLGHVLTSSPSLPAGSMQRLGRTWSDSAMSQILASPSTSSPRYKLKPRPNSPNLQPPTSPALTSNSGVLDVAGNASSATPLPVPSRRISIRAKVSPPPPR